MNLETSTSAVAKALKMPTVSFESMLEEAKRIGLLECYCLQEKNPDLYAKEVERFRKLISDSHTLIPFDGDDRFDELSVIRIGESFEIALKRDGRVVYVDELGYDDVRRFDTEEEVLEEVARLEKETQKK